MITIVGPTASGKTTLAVELAKQLMAMGQPAEIISADSRQVYRRMTIGTGKDLDEYGDVPYHLIDIAEPGERYNVYRFQQDFRTAHDTIVGRGAMPILCGGTGLYVEAVLNDFQFEQQYARGERPLPHGGKMLYGVSVDRETRRAKITRRLHARLDEGMVAEVQGLLDSGVSAERLIRYGLEYKYVTEYCIGARSYDSMIHDLEIAIHQFAKRQMTWFRGMERRGFNIKWITRAEEIIAWENLN